MRRIALWLAAFALAGTLVLALGIASAYASVGAERMPGPPTPSFLR